MRYVFIGAEGTESRAQSLSAIVSALEHGFIHAGTLIRRDDETRWRKVSEHADVAAILGTLGRAPAREASSSEPSPSADAEGSSPAAQAGAPESRAAEDHGSEIADASVAGSFSGVSDDRNPFRPDVQRWRQIPLEITRPHIRLLTAFTAVALGIQLVLVGHGGYLVWAYNRLDTLIFRYG